MAKSDSSREDIIHQLVLIANEMNRQKIGRLKAGPTAMGGLYFDIRIREASPREIARHRCKEVYVRGGRRFQCTLTKNHGKNPCVIKTARSGYQILFGKDSKP